MCKLAIIIHMQDIIIRYLKDTVSTKRQKEDPLSERWLIGDVIEFSFQLSDIS